MTREILTIVITVVGCIGQNAALCLAGYISALRGLIDVDCRKRLNRLNICLFTPALLFGKVAFSLTPDTLKSLWIVPVGFVLVTAVSALTGLILSGIFRANTSQRAIIVSGSMFMNTNTIPVALIQSLSMSLPILKVGPDDKPENQLARALSYLLIYGLLGSFVRWSLGVKLFELANEKMEQTMLNEKPSHQLDHNKPHPRFLDSTHTAPPSAGQNPIYLHANLDITSSPSSQAGQSPLIISEITPSNEETLRTPFLAGHERGSENCDLYYNPTCSCESCDTNKAHRSEDDPACYKSPNRGSTLTEKTLVETLPVAKDFDDPIPMKESSFHKMSKGFLKVSKCVKDILNPPLISAISAVIVACIPPLQEFLGKIEPLRHLLNIAGSVSIPLTLIALGAYFYQPPASESDLESVTPISKTSNQGSPGEIKTIILTLISRQLITPIIFIPILSYFVLHGQIALFRDPIFFMTAVLVIGGPPATTLAQMSSRTCEDFDRVISKMLCWSFSSVTPLTTMALTGAALYIQQLSLH